MNYFVEIQVGYYDDDDSYFGPYKHTPSIEGRSINEVVQHARKFMQKKMEELLEPSPQGTILTIHDESGELCYDHALGIIRPILIESMPPEELIKVTDRITLELMEYLRRNPNRMYNIKPRQFEELIAEILSSYGWEVQLTPPTKDGGYDIFAVSKDVSGIQSSWIVECKKYKQSNKVGVDSVRSLYGAAGDLEYRNIAMMLATTSSFTSGARKYASSKYNFELRDYESILEWINEYKPHPDGKLHMKDTKLKNGVNSL